MRKNIFIFTVILLGFAQVLSAVPAKRGKFIKIQPDGTPITLQLHGDEFLHWTTNEDGTVVAPDADGHYKSATKPSIERMGGRAAADLENLAISARRRAALKLAAKSPSTVTTYHFPVILVQFSDCEFSVDDPNQAFYNLLNQEGYSENGAVGSVHDYYWDNSMNTFDAQFDVFGPVSLSGSVSSYGSDVSYPYNNGSGDQAAKALYQACQSLDGDIDFSKYDNDNDGYVDMVFMYYAGYNEAEGADDSTIWPHKWSFSAWDYYNTRGYSSGTSTNGYSQTKFDGKYIDVYACTSELKGYDGTDMCGIGTCAHEFSHTQGLPDFYDTTYDNYGDGTAGATYSYDIMCEGSYNNEGRTPPYFTAEERIMMGWLDGYEDMPASGEIVIPSVDNNFAYKLSTSNTTGNGEYFVFECRSGQGWDAYVEPGLVVFHVDKSTKYSVTYNNGSSSSRTPYQLWTSYTQYINASGSHPCFYIVPAADQDNLAYSGAGSGMPFPGGEGIVYYTPVDWEGNSYDLFSDITFHSDTKVATMNRSGNYKGIWGYVQNSSGEALEGAKVSIYAKSSSTSNIIVSGPDNISGRVSGNMRTYAYTDENGYYSFDLSSIDGTSLDIEVAVQGYITKYVTFEAGDELIHKDFTMRGINEPIDYTLKKYDRSAGGLYVLGYGSTCTSYGAICLSAGDLSDYVGRKILKLAFAYDMDDDSSVSSVYGIIDFGGTRKLTSKVSSPEAGAWNVIDVSGEDLYVPADTDCYFGFGLVQCTYGYPFIYSDNNPKNGGFNYYLDATTTVSTSAVSWSSLSYGNLLIYVVLDDSSEVDYNYIKNPGYGSYTVGDSLPLTLVEAAGDRKPGSEISWYFDDELVCTSSEAESGESVLLKYAGMHLVEARFTTTDGKTKIVELELNVGL